jgi:hypothetical protein
MDVEAFAADIVQVVDLVRHADLIDQGILGQGDLGQCQSEVLVEPVAVVGSPSGHPCGVVRIGCRGLCPRLFHKVDGERVACVPLAARRPCLVDETGRILGEVARRFKECDEVDTSSGVVDS